LAVQRVTDQQSNHERVCLENQRRIDAAFVAVNARLDKIDTGLRAVSDSSIAATAAAAALAAVAAKPPSPAPWFAPYVRAGVIGLCSAVIGLFGWMASTIWSMEAAKVDALQNRPPVSAVTVNPPAAPTTPQAVPTIP
jgi:hypothetical protein